MERIGRPEHMWVDIILMSWGDRKVRLKLDEECLTMSVEADEYYLIDINT